jgi:hypothetical protein
MTASGGNGWDIVYHGIMHEFCGIAKPAERKNA